MPSTIDQTVLGAQTLTRASRYSYTCQACNRCCRHYRIQANPYEVLHLARYLKLSTTLFIDRYLEEGPYLARTEDGVCVFLGPSGCAVHPARPLVCRLYPLGREITAAGEERFSLLSPHPESEGEYGEDGTVGDYLQSQGALPYIVAADRYFALFQRLFAALQENRSGTLTQNTAESLSTDGREAALSQLLDPDAVIGVHEENDVPVPFDPEKAMELHIAAIESWLTSHFKENSNEEIESQA